MLSCLNDRIEGLLKASPCTSSWLQCLSCPCLLSMHNKRMAINFQHSWSITCTLYPRVITIQLWCPVVWSEHMEFVTAPNNVQSRFRACWYEWLSRSRLDHFNFQIFAHSILVLAACKLLLWTGEDGVTSDRAWLFGTFKVLQLPLIFLALQGLQWDSLAVKASMQWHISNNCYPTNIVLQLFPGWLGCHSSVCRSPSCPQMWWLQIHSQDRNLCPSMGCLKLWAKSSRSSLIFGHHWWQTGSKGIVQRPIDVLQWTQHCNVHCHHLPW